MTDDRVWIVPRDAIHLEKQTLNSENMRRNGLSCPKYEADKSPFITWEGILPY